MKRIFALGFTLFAVLLTARPIIAAEAKIDPCYLGANESAINLEAAFGALSAYAKTPRIEKLVAELITEAKLAIEDAIACRAPNAVLRQMELPGLIAGAQLAHAADLVSLAEGNTGYPSASLLCAALVAIDDAAYTNGRDRPEIAKLNARLAEMIKNRYK